MKPRLRGCLHFGAAPLALVMGLGLLVVTPSARKRPDPYPEWFGYHEVFHAFTITAFLAQFVAIAMVVT